MTKLTIPNKTTFSDSFLSSIGRLGNNPSVKLRFTPERVAAVAIDPDTGVALAAVFKTGDANATLLEDEIICIRDVNKLSFFLSQVPDESVKLTIDNAALCYNTKAMKFRMQLQEESRIADVGFSVDTIVNQPTDFRLEIPMEKLAEINRYSFMAKDVKKLYFIWEDNCIYASFEDKSLDLSDSATILISENSPKFPIFSINYESIAKKIDMKRKGMAVEYRHSDGMVKVIIEEVDYTLTYLMSANAE